mmetsp:Transcript_12913/g.51497  ORF Transcript_12913/g.51497 Transcript_12913/m.51497 type:complete len:213 (-) Transcript_12913:660-1298(-)
MDVAHGKSYIQNLRYHSRGGLRFGLRDNEDFGPGLDRLGWDELILVLCDPQQVSVGERNSARCLGVESVVMDLPEPPDSCLFSVLNQEYFGEGSATLRVNGFNHISDANFVEGLHLTVGHLHSGECGETDIVIAKELDVDVVPDREAKIFLGCLIEQRNSFAIIAVPGLNATYGFPVLANRSHANIVERVVHVQVHAIAVVTVFALLTVITS